MFGKANKIYFDTCDEQELNQSVAGLTRDDWLNSLDDETCPICRRTVQYGPFYEDKRQILCSDSFCPANDLR